MPCRYDDGGEADRTQAANEAKRNAELDKTTRLLCTAARMLDEADICCDASREIAEWYADHEAKDLLRVEAEKAKAADRAKQIQASMEREVKSAKDKIKKMEAELDALKKRIFTK